MGADLVGYLLKGPANISQNTLEEAKAFLAVQSAKARLTFEEYKNNNLA